MRNRIQVLSESFGSWEDMVEGAVQDCDSKHLALISDGSSCSKMDTG